MQKYEELVCDLVIPPLAEVEQVFETECLADTAETLREHLQRPEIKATIKSGMSIAITCGSRSPIDIVPITKTVVDFVKEQGAKAFIFPAMGSHGGATDEGQKEMLASLGITEESMGCPIRSSMQTVHLADLEDGRPVYIDKYASEADGIIVINRVKAHTSFTADYESGLIKMCAIGLGKQYGAEIAHANGLLAMGPEVEAFGVKVLTDAKILFGVGFVENAFHRTYDIRAMLPDEILKEEPAMLKKAKELSARIAFEYLDVLVIDEIGKDIAGPGFDPHVLHLYVVGHPKNNEGRRAKRIVALDLTHASHGCAMGGGTVDLITKRFVDKVDRNATYCNSLTNKYLEPSKLAPYFDTDKLSIQAALKTLLKLDYETLRMVRIKNTLDLKRIWISPALLEEARTMQNIKIISEPKPLPFDEKGNLF